MKAAYNVAHNLAPLVERFFTERLIRQQNVSAHTIASYRDTFRLLFKFAKERLRKAPSALSLDELDAPFIGDHNSLALTAQNILAMISQDSLATETQWPLKHLPSGGLPTR